MKPGTHALLFTEKNGGRPSPAMLDALGDDGAEVEGGIAVSPVGLVKMLLAAPPSSVPFPGAREALEALRRKVAALRAAESVKARPRPDAEILAGLAAPFARALDLGANNTFAAGMAAFHRATREVLFSAGAPN